MTPAPEEERDGVSQRWARLRQRQADSTASAPLERRRNDEVLSDGSRNDAIRRAGDAASNWDSRRVLLVATLLPLFLLIAAGWYDLRILRREARTDLASTADALAGQAQAVLESASLALTLELERVDGLDWPMIRTSRALYDFLVGLHRALPQLESLFLVDPDGFDAASSRAFPMPPYDLRGRDYYRMARRQATRPATEGLGQDYISDPFRGIKAGTIAFTVSRPRIVDGHFDGLVAVTISPGFFEGFYGSALGPGGAAALVRSDGAVLASYPPVAMQIDMLPHGDPLLRRLAAGAVSGLLRARDGPQGRARLAAFRKLRGYPAAVVVWLDVSAYRGLWHTHLLIFAGFALVAGLVLFLSMQLALQRGRRERASLRLLLAETERRQRAEQALLHGQKMEALGRLSGGVAHDFNNLLTAILGGLELAARRVSDERVRALLDVAADAARRGARLTRQMLAFADNAPITPEPVDINALIGQMELVLEPAAGPGVQLRQELAEGLWPALTDPFQLEVALLNLVSNARSAMPEGGTVTLATRNVPRGAASLPAGFEGADHVCIAATDTGAGMPPDVATRAFEPFFTTREVGKGSGLGLSVVYGLARQSGGTATIRSAPGEGTTVALFLPRAAAVPAARPIPADGAGSVAGRRLLLLDDDAMVRSLTEEMLREIGHEVVTVGSGEAALAQLARSRFDLLLLDYTMPGMDGGEVAGRVATTWPDLPILFVTGFADSAGLGPWARRGYPVLRKPFRAGDLTAAVVAGLRRGRADGRVVALRGG